MCFNFLTQFYSIFVFEFLCVDRRKMRRKNGQNWKFENEELDEWIIPMRKIFNFVKTKSNCQVPVPIAKSLSEHLENVHFQQHKGVNSVCYLRQTLRWR